MSPATTKSRRSLRIALTVIAGIVLAFGMCCYRSLVRFQTDFYGWPFHFYESATFYSFSLSKGMYLVTKILLWAAAATFACWCLITFAIWRRCMQQGKWQFTLASAFRWLWSAAVLLWIAQSLDSLWMGPLLSDKMYQFAGDLMTRFTLEPIVYLGAFVAIDYYTQQVVNAFAWLKQRVMSRSSMIQEGADA